MDRYLILAVEYEFDATDTQRSLGWVAPELVDAGLTMTYDTPSLRKWAGFIDGETFERFIDSWGSDAQPANYHHTWDGMEWKLEGQARLFGQVSRLPHLSRSSQICRSCT